MAYQRRFAAIAPIAGGTGRGERDVGRTFPPSGPSTGLPIAWFPPVSRGRNTLIAFSGPYVFGERRDPPLPARRPCLGPARA